MTTTPFIQSLERRELLAVTASFSKGTIYIRGTELADVIHVRQVNGVIGVVGTAALFPASQVKSIAIDARGGDDDVYIFNPVNDPTAEFISKSCVIVGGAGNDTIVGGFGRDVILGNDGNDSLFGAWGEDAVFGGFGDDTINAGDGDDIVFGNAGADSIDGLAGNDTLSGGSENDTLLGNEGDDLLLGDAGFDTLSGGPGRNVLSDTPFNGYVRVPDATGSDQLTNAPITRPDHKIFKPYHLTVLADMNSLSQRLPTNGKVKKPLGRMVGKFPYEGLFEHKRITKFFGVGVKAN